MRQPTARPSEWCSMGQDLMESLEPRSLMDATSALSPYNIWSHSYPPPVIADINHDGHPDTILGTQTGFQVRFGKPGGREAVFDVSLGGHRGTYIAVGKFDGDDRLDIAVGWHEGAGKRDPGGIELFSSRRGGVFAQIGSIPAAGIESLAAADFNGDGRAELIAARTVNISGPIRFEVRRYTFDAALPGGGGGLRSGGKLFNWTGVIATPIVADVDGDGNPDVLLGVRAYVYLGDANIQLFHGRGDGTFTQTEAYRFATPTALFGLSIGDLNGDGRVDIAVLSQDGASRKLSYLTGQVGGGFAPAAPLPPTFVATLGTLPGIAGLTIEGGSPIRTFDIGDFNHDGHADIRMQVLTNTDEAPGQRPLYITHWFQVDFAGDGMGGVAPTVVEIEGF